MKHGVAAALFLGFFLSAQAQREVRPEHDHLRYGVVENVPGMERVRVQSVTFKTVAGQALQMDLFYPPGASAKEALPVVVFVNGVGDRPGFAKVRTWGQYTSWPRLVAASGLAAVTFDSRGEAANAEDVRDAFAYVRDKGTTLGIDPTRMAAWSCSANVRAAMALLMQPGPLPVRTAVAYYGDGDFAEVRKDLPLLLVRAGKDRPQMNEQLDRMAARALAANAPWTVLNVPGGHHAFDVLDDTEESREAIRATLSFLNRQLLPSPTAARVPDEARTAMAHFFSREWADAEAAYTRWVEKHPDDADALVYLGNAQVELGKPDEAAVNLRKALALDPSIGEAWAMLGRIEHEKKNYAAALQDLDKAVTLMPEDSGAHHQIGKVRLAQREIPAAVTSLERAVELAPMNGWAWHDLAFAYLAAKEPAKAAAAFEKVLPYAPQNPTLLYNTACAYALSGDPARALDLLDRAVASGFTDKAGLMADPDLATVRSDPRFAEIVKRLG